MCVHHAIKHATACELIADSSELAESHKSAEDLAEWLLAAQTMPGPLDSDNVLRFRDGRAETIRRTEKLDTAYIMNECMLVWEREAIRAYASRLENNAQAVKPGQGCLHVAKILSDM